MKAKIGIVGAGAVGSFIGGMLSKAGENITLIDGWPDHIKTIKRLGLRISGTQGEHIIRLNAIHINEVQRFLTNPFDITFICTKSYDTAWSTALIADYLSPSGFVVSLQNGFNEEIIGGIIGPHRVLGCVASTLGAELIDPGHVTRSYMPGGSKHYVFRVGEIDSSKTQRVAKIVHLLSKVDSTTETTNLWGERWSKLVANAISNPLASITGLNDREMSVNPRVRNISIRIGAEAIAVGQAMGYSLNNIHGIEANRWIDASNRNSLEDLHEDLKQTVYRATDSGRPSTPVDIALGRRTELEFFNGLVISEGARLGIPTPVNMAALKLVNRIENDFLSPDPKNIELLEFY